MIIGVLIGLIILLANYGEHRQFVQRLETEGLETQGSVDFASPEYGWAHMDYVDADGEARSGVLDMHYYDPELWQTLTPDTSVPLRYLPWHIPGSDRVILAEHFAEVQAYHGYLAPDLLGLVGICWLVVILKPQFLYVGLIDAEELFKEGLPS